MQHRPKTGMERPATGMIRAGTSQGGRRFADGTYFETEPSQRIANIQAEILKIRNAKDSVAGEAREVNKLQTEYESLLSTVRDLEGELADFNLALDKVRTFADPDMLMAACEQLEEQNRGEAKRVDAVFLERSKLDEHNKTLKEDINDSLNRLRLQMQQSDPSLATKFHEMERQFQNSTEELQARKQALVDVEHKLMMLDGKMESEQFSAAMRSVELKKRFISLSEEKVKLLEDTDSNLSEEKFREKVRTQVSRAKKELEDVLNEISIVEGDISSLQRQIQDREKQKEEIVDFLKSADKYEKLFERDQKITDRLRDLPDKIANLQREIRICQHQILALSQHLSNHLALDQVNVGDEYMDLGEATSRLEERAKQSEQTLEHIREGLEQRKAELQKIEMLSSNIENELKRLTERHVEMKMDMEKFKSHSELLKDHTNLKQKLRRKIEEAKQESILAEHEFRQVKPKYDNLCRKVAQHSEYQNLQQREKKLSQIQQNLYQLEQTTYQLKCESDYERHSNQVQGLIKKLNQILIESSDDMKEEA